MIPCSNPKAQYLAHRAEIDAAVRTVLDSGQYIHGPQCQRFEEAFASWLGARFAIGVANGTDAIRLALMACGIGPGDEVITTPHTAVATVSAIEQTGALPVLVDVEDEYLTLDPARVARAITPRTKAIVPVHIYGNTADIGDLTAIATRYGLRLIEDCAQAHGALHEGKRAGTFGDLACFSFYPTKNLGALGDGGMVTTDDAQLAAKCRELREYGWRERYISEVSGINSRLDELQAAVLNVKLKYLDGDIARRRQIAARYNQAFARLPVRLPEDRPGGNHAYHLYVIRSQRREDLRARLAHQGIGTGVHYPMPVHLQPAYRSRLSPVGGMPIAERASLEILTLPLFPELSDSDVDAIIREFTRCHSAAA